MANSTIGGCLAAPISIGLAPMAKRAQDKTLRCRMNAAFRSQPDRRIYPAGGDPGRNPPRAPARIFRSVSPTGRRSADLSRPGGMSRISNPMPPGFDAELRGAHRPSACPGGTYDNSPTFQRWVGAPKPGRVPKGRLSGRPMSAVPSGLVRPCAAKPNVEPLGYYHASLRDGHEIRVALDFQSADATKQAQPADWKSAIRQVGNLRYAASGPQ